MFQGKGVVADCAGLPVSAVTASVAGRLLMGRAGLVCRAASTEYLAMGSNTQKADEFV